MRTFWRFMFGVKRIRDAKSNRIIARKKKGSGSIQELRGELWRSCQMCKDDSDCPKPEEFWPNLGCTIGLYEDELGRRQPDDVTGRKMGEKDWAQTDGNVRFILYKEVGGECSWFVIWNSWWWWAPEWRKEWYDIQPSGLRRWGEMGAIREVVIKMLISLTSYNRIFDDIIESDP